MIAVPVSLRFPSSGWNNIQGGALTPSPARTVEQLERIQEFTRLELSQEQLDRLTAAGQ